MSYPFDVTVAVGTYNPEWHKLHATLQSILNQENINFQIIVSDDGSANPFFNEVENLFKEIDFKDYKLVRGKNNEGTVCQFHRALQSADSEYVKGISPGDLFYDNNTLSKWLAFIKEKKADISFCDAVFYNKKSDDFNIIKHKHNPRNMAIYLSPSSYEDKVINYLIFDDTISGATILAKRDLLIHYMNLLLHKVIYVEDFFLRLAVLNGIDIKYYPEPGIWYEFGDGGISTSKSDVWQNRIRKDYIAMNHICLNHWMPCNEKVNKWIMEDFHYKEKKNISFSDKLKYKLRYIRHPKWYYWKIYRKFNISYSPTNVDTTFLKQYFL